MICISITIKHSLVSQRRGLGDNILIVLFVLRYEWWTAIRSLVAYLGTLVDLMALSVET